MPTRGRIPRFLVFFVIAVASVALVSVEIIREQRSARANIGEKELQLENVRMDLKEQVKVALEREKERDTAQTRLLELERLSKSGTDSLHQKDSELLSLKTEYDRTVEELSRLKKVVKQKDEEIVHIRKKLQDYSFEKAKESAEQTVNNNVMESSLENRQGQEHKPADEAGLGDRKDLHEDEEATFDGHLSATAKEMDERSKPKQDVLNEGQMTNLGETTDKEADSNAEEFSKPGDLHAEEAEEQDNADTRNADEKDVDASQDVDLNEVTKFDADMQTGHHDDADAQEADRDVE